MTRVTRSFEHFNDVFNKAIPTDFIEVNTEILPIDKRSMHPSFMERSLNKKYYSFDEFLKAKFLRRILNRQETMTLFLNNYSAGL
jgi:hypothetical protein